MFVKNLNLGANPNLGEITVQLKTDRKKVIVGRTNAFTL